MAWRMTFLVAASDSGARFDSCVAHSSAASPRSSAATDLFASPELHAALGIDPFAFNTELERPPIPELPNQQPVEAAVGNE